MRVNFAAVEVASHKLDVLVEDWQGFIVDLVVDSEDGGIDAGSAPDTT